MGKIVPINCKHCGALRTLNDKGKLCCRPCATAKLNKRRARLKLAGLCVTCGRVSVVETSSPTCVDCRKRKVASQKKVESAREGFVCKNCGGALDSNSLKWCEKCLEVDRSKKRAIKEKGLCTNCYKVPAPVGYTRCDDCRELQKVRRRARAASGVCGYTNSCPNPNAEGKFWCQYHLDRNSSRSAKRRRTERELVVATYGGCCACCGETQYEFLAIDHVHGGGSKEFKESGVTTLASVVIREGFPDRFRLLCHNCNMARGLYGACPHEEQVTKLTLVKKAS